MESGSLAQGGHPSLNMMHRVWEKGSTLLFSFAQKIGGLKRTVRTGSNSDRIAEKALDSLKIQLRLLAHESAWSEIRQIAESSEDQELVSHAVSYLCEDDAQVTAELVRLCRSNSHACLPALISLFNLGETDLAESILLERLRTGDYFALIESNKARPLLFLDVLGAVDDFKQSDLCLQYFPRVWHCLADRPDEREKLLAEILGDLNPGGLRYSPDANMIPQAVKIQVLQLLHALRPESYERSLWYASREADDNVSYMATMACTEYWQNDGALPSKVEPFALLNLNLLFYLSKLASTFHWRGPAGVLQRFADWNKDMDRLDSLDPQTDKEEYSLLKAKTDKVRTELLDITEQRLNALQPIVDAVTNSLGLPHAKIRSTDLSGVAAAYLVGTGTVEFSKNTLLDDRPLTEEFMSSMLHELGHMEQDALIIKMIADQIGLKFGQHGNKLKILFQHYANAIGYAPDSIFLLEVLRLRGDRELTDAERKRAERLIEAAYENLSSAQDAKRITERMARIEESVAGIESGTYDWQLLDCLRDERSLLPLFDNGYVPAVLLDEMRDCRTCIEDIVGAMKSVDPEGVRRIFGKADSISIAQHLFSEQSGEDLAPIVERFRIVVSHMLSEEHRRLDKKLSEIRRAGYHEAEAYIISDRVEVIVKALRRGWYEFTA